MELVTAAFEYVPSFNWRWIFLPIAIGLLVIIITAFWSVYTGNRGFVGYLIGTAVALVAGFFTFITYSAGGSSFDQDLLRSDMAEQLQIHETVQNGNWYTGEDSDGEFVKFALIKQDNTENTYSVLMEK